MKQEILFIGLGNMGFPMAGHLCKNPHFSVTVWNRSVNKSTLWAEKYNGFVAKNLMDAAAKTDVLITCVGRDEDMKEIMFGDLSLACKLKPDALMIDHTTTSYQMALRLHEALGKVGAAFVDAPVSGGEAGAINGVLSIMVGGNKTTFARTQHIMEAYGKTVTHMGGIGFGQLTKMVNQICIGGVLEGLSEAVRFAKAEGIEIGRLTSAIGGGAAQSWQMDNRMKTMAEESFDFGFAIKWMIKDLSYCLERGIENNSDLSTTKRVYEAYQSLAEIGHQDKDTSALILSKNKL